MIEVEILKAARIRLRQCSSNALDFQRRGLDDQERNRAAEWAMICLGLAQAIEAGTAETVKQGSVHESAVPERDAP